MKKIIALMILLSAPAISAQGWTAVNFDSKEVITGLHFISPDTGFLVTRSGKFSKTFDSGKSWQTYTVNDGQTLEDLHFLTPSIGLACGQSGQVFRTTDGGKLWKEVVSRDTTAWFFDIEMFDNTYGLVVGLIRTEQNPMGGIALRTQDGGKSWAKLGAMGMGFSEIFHFPDGMAYFLSYGNINFSSNNGKTWQSRRTHDGKPARTLSLFGSSAIIAGPGGAVYYSEDAGNTWIPSPQEKDHIYVSSAMVSETQGYIGGIDTPLMFTSDGGKTWGKELGAKSFSVLDMFLIEDILWAAGSDGGIMYKKVR